MFVRTSASFGSGQWPISRCKSSASDLLCRIRHTHAQPKSESGVHKRREGISFLRPPLDHLLVFSNALGLPHFGPPSTTLGLSTPCSILHFQQLHLRPRQNADGEHKAAGTCPHPLETAALVTEKGSLPSEFLTFRVLPATAVPYQETHLPFPKLEQERFS